MPIPEVNFATPRVKSSNEILVYMNMDVGQITNTAVMIDGTVETKFPGALDHGDCCGMACPCPDPGWEATVIQNKNEGAIVGVGGVLPIHSFLFAAIEGTVLPTANGDMVNHVCLPDDTNDILVCHDQGASATPGLVFQDIARKFNPVDHRIRQRPENTLTLQNLFVSSWVGLQRFMGVACTVIIKVNPDGMGMFQEMHYYTDVMLAPMPMDSGEGNDPINISMTGTYSFAAIFGNTGGGNLVA